MAERDVEGGDTVVRVLARLLGDKEGLNREGKAKEDEQKEGEGE